MWRGSKRVMRSLGLRESDSADTKIIVFLLLMANALNFFIYLILIPLLDALHQDFQFTIKVGTLLSTSLASSYLLARYRLFKMLSLTNMLIPTVSAVFLSTHIGMDRYAYALFLPAALMGFTIQLKDVYKYLHYGFVSIVALMTFFVTGGNGQGVLPELSKEMGFFICMSVSSILCLFIVFSVMVKNKYLEAQIIRRTEELNSSLAYAGELQKSTLPPDGYLKKVLVDHFILFKPLEAISGDFYFVKSYGGFLYVVCADATGHGIPGAMISMIGNSVLRQIIEKERELSPAKILKKLNYALMDSFNRFYTERIDGLDMSVVVVDTERNRLSYCGAKNPLVIVGEEGVQEIKGIRRAIGDVDSFDKDFFDKEYYFQSDVKIYLFSDGLIDQFGGRRGKRFMKRRLLKEIERASSLPMSLQKQRLQDVMEEWMLYEEQVDDMLLMGIQIRAKTMEEMIKGISKKAS